MSARVLFILGSLAVALHAQSTPTALTAAGATNRQVQLTWKGGGTEFVVERRVQGGQYAALATAQTAAFTDTRFDAFTTYQYRIRAGAPPKLSEPSNEVTVGPPPVGFQLAVAAPAKAQDKTLFGRDGVMTLDASGDPAFAYLWLDPNEDGNYGDGAVYFANWNRAQAKWNPAVQVAVVGDAGARTGNSLSLTCDPATNTYVLAFADANAKSVKLAVSTDAGATWKTQDAIAPEADAAATFPQVVLRDGVLHLAAFIQHIGIRYYTGKLVDDPKSWKPVVSPTMPRTATFGLALDSHGVAAIAFFTEDDDKSKGRVMLWRPVAGKVTQAADLGSAQDDFPAAVLVFDKDNPRIFMCGTFDTQKFFDNQVWFLHSEDSGATWAAPVMIPADGQRSTNYPFSFAIDSKSAAALVFGSFGGSTDPSCGPPALARSQGLNRFVTCGAGGKAPKYHFGGSGYGASNNLKFAGNDKLYVLWQDSEPKLGTGLFFWREP